MRSVIEEFSAKKQSIIHSRKQSEHHLTVNYSKGNISQRKIFSIDDEEEEVRS
jgi:hypothetical protein